MKKVCTLLSIILILSFFSGCSKENEKKSPLTEIPNPESNISENEDSQSDENTEISIEDMDFDFTDNDLTPQKDGKTPKSENGIITITDGNTYKITGSHTQIVINAKDTDKPKIILENVQINCENGPSIYIKQADKVFITIPDGTTSTIKDGETYQEGYDNADSTIFSKADLTINGSGTLKIEGNYKGGIVSKDDLTIIDTKLNITSKGSSIEGKDCVKIMGAIIDINADTDGIKSTNTQEAHRGFIYVKSGDFNITAQKDGIQAQTLILVEDGNFNIKTGGGSAVASNNKNSDWGSWDRNPNAFSPNNQANTQTETQSAKALKSSNLIKLNGGTFTIDSSDDSIHSNNDIEINNGTFSLNSGDDGLHADNKLTVNDCTLTLSKSYEGLEATVIKINGGNLDITASDDGLNSAGGNDSSSLGGRPGQNPFESDENALIEINGGYLLLNASGDGIDSNGNINVNGGITLVSGPTNSGNGALDKNGTALVNGGTVILIGSSGMAETFSEKSNQCSLSYGLTDMKNGGTNIALSDKSGKVLASFTPQKNYSHIVITCPEMKENSDYNLCIGGDITNADKNGYTSTGKINNPSETLEVTISSVATSYGNSGGMGGGMNRPDGGMNGGMDSPPNDRKNKDNFYNYR